jgi:DNA polymerase-3 subunit gamma/tau
MMNLAAILKLDKPKLKDGIVQLTFPNQGTKETLEQEKTPLLQFLREKLQNHSIDVNIKVDQKTTKKYVVTDKEVYDIMVKKNPRVDELRRKLNLKF